jgi:hypothetical protein
MTKRRLWALWLLDALGVPRPCGRPRIHARPDPNRPSRVVGRPRTYTAAAEQGALAALMVGFTQREVRAQWRIPKRVAQRLAALPEVRAVTRQSRRVCIAPPPRLASCDRYHPTEPPELHTYARRGGRWSLQQRYCRKCNRLRYHARNPSVRHRRAPIRRPQPYGVARLTWTPPNVLRETASNLTFDSEVTA